MELTECPSAIFVPPSKKEFNIPFQLRQNHIQTSFFTGREDILQHLHKALGRSGSLTQPVPVTLFGQGGIGKTQIALEYARRHSREFSAIIWLDATSQETLRYSFQQFATQLKQHYDMNRLNETAFYPRLANLSEPLMQHRDLVSVDVILDCLNLPNNNGWLLIYDNVDNIDHPELFDVRDFFPESHHGNIIITSRRWETILIGIEIEVDVFSDEDGLSLLQRNRNIRQGNSQTGEHKFKCFGDLLIQSRPDAISRAPKQARQSSSCD